MNKQITRHTAGDCETICGEGYSVGARGRRASSGCSWRVRTAGLPHQQSGSLDDPLSGSTYAGYCTTRAITGTGPCATKPPLKHRAPPSAPFTPNQPPKTPMILLRAPCPVRRPSKRSAAHSGHSPLPHPHAPTFPCRFNADELQ